MDTKSLIVISSDIVSSPPKSFGPMSQFISYSYSIPKSTSFEHGFSEKNKIQRLKINRTNEWTSEYLRKSKPSDIEYCNIQKIANIRIWILATSRFFGGKSTKFWLYMSIDAEFSYDHFDTKSIDIWSQDFVDFPPKKYRSSHSKFLFTPTCV